MRRLLSQLFLLLLLSQLQLPGSHALVRGHRHERTGAGKITRRFLSNNQMNNNGNNNPNNPNNNNVVPGGDTAPPSRKPPPAPVAVAPATPPTDSPSLAAETFTTSSPVASDSGKKSPTNAPSLSPDTASPVVVNLVAFVVSAESTAPQGDVTSSLEAYLTEQLKPEFDSLISVLLVLQTRKQGSGRRRLLDELAYTGTASFASDVSSQAVRDAQLVVLQDSAAVQQAVPSVTSVQLAANDNVPTSAPETSTSTGTSMGLTIGVSIVATLAVLIAAYFAYRYYSTPPPPPPAPLASKDGSRKKPPKTSSVPKSQYPSDDAGSQSASGYLAADGRSVEIDDYSLDGFSAQGSEAGLDKTELYLLQRYKAKKERDHQQSLMANPNQPPSEYYFNNNNHDDNCDESDAGFSYEQVGTKGAESDDDLYTTTSSAIEVSLDGSTTFMTGYFGALGKGNRESTNSTKAATKKSTTPTTRTPAAAAAATTATRGKREVNEIPFDESSVDRPFDEMPPVKKALPTPASIRAAEQARVIANQVPYERDSGNNIDSDEDYPVDRTRSGNSRKSADSDKEDLSSFLRDRRQAKRAARKSRESRKQPPVSMEV